MRSDGDAGRAGERAARERERWKNRRGRRTEGAGRLHERGEVMRLFVCGRLSIKDGEKDGALVFVFTVDEKEA